LVLDDILAISFILQKAYRQNGCIFVENNNIINSI